MNLERMRPQGPIWRNAAILLVLCLGLHVFQVSVSNRLVLGGNEAAHVKLLHSMVVRGTLAIDPPGDLSFYRGRHFSNKPPGFPMVLAPAYATYVYVSGNRSLDHAFYFTKYANALLSAGTVVAIFLLLSSFPLSTGAILFGVAAATIGTIFPAYSCLANSLPLSIFLCVGVLLAARHAQIRPASRVARSVIVFGSSLAIAVDYANAFFLLPVLIWVGIDVLKRREWLALVGGLVPVALVLIYNAIAFDDPLSISYAHYKPPRYVPWDGAANSLSLLNVPRGLFGLLMSPGRGLFVLSPVALLGTWALYTQARAREMDRLWIAAPIVAGILIMSAYALWHGGHSVGYRHVLVAGFVLAALSAFAFESFPRRGRIAALALLTASSVSGLGSFWIQLDPALLRLTWKAEPADVHAAYYPELLIPKLTSVGSSAPDLRRGAPHGAPLLRPAPSKRSGGAPQRP